MSLLNSQLYISLLRNIRLNIGLDKLKLGSTAVRCTRSTSVAWGLPVWIPGADMALLGKTHAVEWNGRKMGMDVCSGPVFLSKKRRIGSS